MELQEIKEKFRETQNRYLLCKYKNSFVSNDFVQVVLDVISEEAEFVNVIDAENDIFEQNSKGCVCYVKADYFSSFIEEDTGKEFEYFTTDEKRKCLDEYLKDKLAIIKPFYYYSENRDLFFKNGTVADIIECYNNDITKYYSVPVIRNYSVYNNLINKENFPLPAVSKKIMGVPEYIFYNSKIYKVDLEAVESNDCYWHEKKDKDICEVQIDYKKLTEKNELVECNDSEFVFISRESLLKSKVKIIKKEQENNNFNNSDELDDSYGYSEKATMINSFFKYTKNSNLCYSMDDIFNFFTCLCSSQLIILAGMTGTGKTKLPLKFAEYFKMTEDNQKLLFVPVSPSFTEPADILGYLNPNTGLYNSSETRLIEFLRHAEENQDEMHMVIFDEMNLAQIEFWFAPFISVLEKEINERTLYLYSDHQRCINNERFPNKINIGSNIIFVGTINLDETTKNISDRLLDRSYVINLKKESFSNYYAQQVNKAESEDGESNKSETDFIKFMPGSVNAKNKNYISNFSINQLDFFDDIHAEMNKIDNQKGISFRSVKNISIYMDNRPKEFDERKAFDYAIKQTIIKKISGSVDNIGYFIGYNSSENDDKNTTILQIFDKYEMLSDFKESRTEINNKIIELSKYGYTR